MGTKGEKYSDSILPLGSWCKDKYLKGKSILVNSISDNHQYHSYVDTCFVNFNSMYS